MARKTTSASGFATSLILGLLLIPISAVAAFAIVSNSTAGDTPPSTTVVADDTTTTTTGPTVDTIVVEPVTASADDLARACGADGALLVDAERAGTISDVQQAALDALRQVCAEAGLELAGPPEPDPIVQTVTVRATASQGDGAYGGSHDDEYEDHDEDDEDEHDEDDEHDEHDEHEDDD